MSINRIAEWKFDSRVWLLGISTGLILIHLTLVYRSGQSDLFGTSVLYWVAVASLIWQRREELKLTGSIGGTVLGACLVAIVLLRSQPTASVDFFLRVSPFLSLLGVGLIASGIKGVKQYWQELMILLVLIPHGGFLSRFFDISEITARVATAVLWYSGFDVSRRGVYIVLPTGSVEVNPGCSGYGSIMQLLGVAIIFMIMFQVVRFPRWIILAVAVLIAFFVNCVRVALMATLATSDQAAFEYWHSGDGSLLFSMISVILFGFFCYLVNHYEQPASQE